MVLMKRWQKLAVAVPLLFATIQVVTYDRTNPKVTADINVATDVKAVLKRGCYDCHSNETAWPWYTHVAPISWLVHRDVTQGRTALNFSEWESLPADRQAKLRKESGEEIAEGEMPPALYAPLHPHALLTPADKDLLRTWTEGPREASF
jgi:hypothetical protein